MDHLLKCFENIKQYSHIAWNEYWALKTVFFSYWVESSYCQTSSFNGLGKDNLQDEMRNIKFWDLVQLILEVWQ